MKIFFLLLLPVTAFAEQIPQRTREFGMTPHDHYHHVLREVFTDITIIGILFSLVALYFLFAYRRKSPDEVGRQPVLSNPAMLGWLIIPATLSPDDFLASFGAALSFVNPALAHEGNRDLVERWRKRMAKYLTDDQLTALRAIVSGYLGEKTHGGLEDWLEGVEFTCNRAGFLLTGDLDAAMAMIQALPARLARSPFRTHVRKMVMYAISEEYLALREKLGLAIQV